MNFFLLLILVFCAIVSHPADTIVSYMNKAQGATVGSAARDLGFSGMWAGLGPRIIMIGTLTALQWFIYDSVKVRKNVTSANLHAYFKLNLKFIFRSFSASLAHPHQKCPNL